MSTQLLPGNTMLWKTLWSNRLGREVSLALLAKLVLLMLIWWVFFSDPVDQHLSHDDVARVVTTPQSVPPELGRHD